MVIDEGVYNSNTNKKDIIIDLPRSQNQGVVINCFNDCGRKIQGTFKVYQMPFDNNLLKPKYTDEERMEMDIEMGGVSKNYLMNVDAEENMGIDVGVYNSQTNRTDGGAQSNEPIVEPSKQEKKANLDRTIGEPSKEKRAILDRASGEKSQAIEQPSNENRAILDRAIGEKPQAIGEHSKEDEGVNLPRIFDVLECGLIQRKKIKDKYINIVNEVGEHDPEEERNNIREIIKMEKMIIEGNLN